MGRLSWSRPSARKPASAATLAHGPGSAFHTWARCPLAQSVRCRSLDSHASEVPPLPPAAVAQMRTEGPCPARLSCFNPWGDVQERGYWAGPLQGAFAELTSWDCSGRWAYQSEALCLSTSHQGGPEPSPAHSGWCGRATRALPRSCGSRLPCRTWSSLRCSCEASLSRGPWTASERT